MTVDWFLTDAPFVVPAEFTAWSDARDRHYAVVTQWCDEVDEATRNAPDVEVQAVKSEVDALEAVARRAWRHARATHATFRDDASAAGASPAWISGRPA